MTNLTEQTGLRKLMSIEQFNRQAHIEREPGVVGRLFKWLFGGKKENPDQRISHKYTDQDIESLRDLEFGTEVGLRRAEWDDYRVMIVDQRLRIHPLPGISALTQEMSEIKLDINVAYKVWDVDYVAFGVDDPLAMLQSAVLEKTLNIMHTISLNQITHRSFEIADAIRSIGRLSESGLEVIDARVNVVLPTELKDKMTRVNRAKLDAESMLAERESIADVKKRIDQIDFEAETRDIQNKQELQKIKDKFERENQLGQVDHDASVQGKKDQFQRDQEWTNEVHRLNIIKEKFRVFTEMLRSVGVNPQLAIMMMDGDNWQRFFDRFQKLASVGEDHRGEQLKQIHTHINDLVNSNQLSEDNIQKLLGYLGEESKYLGNRPSIMKQFEVFLDESKDSNNPLIITKQNTLGDSSTSGKTIIEHEIDENSNHNIEDEIASSNNNEIIDSTQSYPSRGELGTINSPAE